MQNFLQLYTFVTKLADKVKTNQVDISSLREENASLRHELATIAILIGIPHRTEMNAPIQSNYS